ncbi:MAG: hypothetical protein HY363_03570 [Candidatus Aenigmarchaeota archaeon]|nr:hypothetical protein [Candidatus Aenigmarchaeota archaeon]
MSDFQQSLRQLQQALGACQKGSINPYQSQNSALINDFKKQQLAAAHTAFHTALKVVLSSAGKVDADIHTLHSLRKVCEKLKTADDLASCKTVLDEMSSLAVKIIERPQTKSSLDLFAIPADIRDEISADMNEVQKCYDAGCYRSVVILCGRLLETALHRKYFEATGNDLLETAPGIGLGSLIAKMNEKGISLDPALSNQIHLINQVRVFSVHKKNTAFSPSKEQAQAIMLYTLDVFNKLFGKT